MRKLELYVFLHIGKLAAEQIETTNRRNPDLSLFFALKQRKGTTFH